MVLEARPYRSYTERRARHQAKFLAIGGGVFGVLFLALILYFVTFKKDAEVVGFDWRCAIHVQQFSWVKEQNDYVPRGGIVLRTWEESDAVYDSEGNFSHWDYYDMYEYKIQRWIPSRVVVTEGQDQNPVWAPVVLRKAPDPEREANRVRELLVSVRIDSDVKQCPVKLEQFQDLDKSQPVTANVNVYGVVRSLEIE